MFPRVAVPRRNSKNRLPGLRRLIDAIAPVERGGRGLVGRDLTTLWRKPSVLANRPFTRRSNPLLETAHSRRSFRVHLFRHGQDVAHNFFRALLGDKVTAIRDHFALHVLGHHFDHCARTWSPSPFVPPSATTGTLTLWL